MEQWLTLWCMFNTAAIMWVGFFRVRKIIVHSGTTVTKIDKYTLKSRKAPKK